MKLTDEQLNTFAAIGAKARLEELEAERKAILEAFPDLQFRPGAGVVEKRRRGRRPVPKAEKRAARRTRKTAGEKAKKPLTEKQRATLEKMWAARRKQAAQARAEASEMKRVMRPSATLPLLVARVLREANEPLAIGEIFLRVRRKGWRTASGDPKGVLGVTLNAMAKAGTLLKLGGKRGHLRYAAAGA
ncbi:MAG: hypothetical protein ACE148_10130 [Vicinamibacterales bacterium]